MILLTTRRNRSSSIAETYPVGKVRPILGRTGLATGTTEVEPSSSDPLVGGLSWRTRIRGALWATEHDDGPRTSLSAVIRRLRGTRGSPRG